MLGFEFLTVGFLGSIWIMKKYFMHQWKNIAGPHVFFIQTVIIWQKKKKKEKKKEEKEGGGGGFYICISTLWIKALSCVSQSIIGM